MTGAYSSIPMTKTGILWFRRDLRIADNPALDQAMVSCEHVLPLYIHAPDEESPWAPGAASNWWLHASLAALDQRLRDHGSRLIIAQGPSLDTLRRIAHGVGANRVFWNRLYDPVTRERDTHVKAALHEQGIRCESHNALLLQEPWDLSTGSGGPYRVYSAFWRKYVSLVDQPSPITLPDVWRPAPSMDGADLRSLQLRPTIPWDNGLTEHWRPGERSAIEHARAFVANGLKSYAEQRDLPALDGTARLSSHLHFGEIGPRQLLALIAEPIGSALDPAAEQFLRELVWREFAYHLLFHFPRTADSPLDPRFQRFPWRIEHADEFLNAWQRGLTGVPFVDAGMRELWRTGWMHNRVRMVVASYLTKNLRLPWQAGARWFWDTLVDADLANNTLGWQWVAGCGADAAPYFRIFNPVRQGERFDPAGDYVKRWCPELSGLGPKHIHQPWTASESVLHAAGITLGEHYPTPLVDLAISRNEALAAFDSIKKS